MRCHSHRTEREADRAPRMRRPVSPADVDELPVEEPGRVGDRDNYEPLRTRWEETR